MKSVVAVLGASFVICVCGSAHSDEKEEAFNKEVFRQLKVKLEEDWAPRLGVQTLEEFRKESKAEVDKGRTNKKIGLVVLTELDRADGAILGAFSAYFWKGKLVGLEQCTSYHVYSLLGGPDSLKADSADNYRKGLYIKSLSFSKVDDVTVGSEYYVYNKYKVKRGEEKKSVRTVLEFQRLDVKGKTGIFRPHIRLWDESAVDGLKKELREDK